MILIFSLLHELGRLAPGHKAKPHFLCDGIGMQSKLFGKINFQSLLERKTNICFSYDVPINGSHLPQEEGYVLISHSLGNNRIVINNWNNILWLKGRTRCYNRNVQVSYNV